MTAAFDRTVFNVRERPLSSDQNNIVALSDYTLRSVLENLMTTQAWVGSSPSLQTGQRTPFVPANGARFFADGFAMLPDSGMTLSVLPGLGFFNSTTPMTGIGSPGIVGLDDLSIYKPIALAAPQALLVPASDPSQPRWDILEVSWTALLSSMQGRQQIDTSSGIFLPATLPKVLTYGLDGTLTINGAGAINYKTGAPNPSPTVPTADAGYVAIGRVYVAAGATTLDFDAICDDRWLCLPGNTLQLNLTGVHNGASGTSPAGPNLPCSSMAGIRVGGYSNGDGSTVFVIAAGNLAHDCNTFGSASIVPIGMTAPTGVNGSALLLPFLAQASGSVSSTITSTMQSNLADATKSASPTKWCVGQNCIVARVRMGSIAQGASNAVKVSTTNGPTNIGLNLNISLATA